MTSTRTRSVRAATALLPVLLMVFVGAAATSASAAVCATGWSNVASGVCQRSFSYNGTGTKIGTVQHVTVPVGVTALTMAVSGTQGASSAAPNECSCGPSAGGKGGRTTAAVAVTPGDTLTVLVGASGASVPSGGWVLCGTCPPSGAFGGGGVASSNFGGDGGGGSFVFDGLANPAGGTGNPLVVAGGGGGGGYDYNTDASHGFYGPEKAPGGAGSGAGPAADGKSVAFKYDPTFPTVTHYPPGGGGGATPAAAGVGGHSLIPPSYLFGQIDGLPGGGPATLPDPTLPQYTWLALGFGGNSQKGTCCYYYGEGGGGGGGYNGGGGGGTIEADLEGGGGGGGAGYAAPGATGVMSGTGAQPGSGKVTLQYTLAGTILPTTTMLASKTNPTVYGQKTTFTAVVQHAAPIIGAPSGTVDFFDELGPIATGVALSGGVASVTVSNLPVGFHGIHADYSGSPGDAVSHASITQTVGAADTATTTTAGPLTTPAGTTVTITAKVKAVAPGTGTPTGTVTIYDGSQPLFGGTLVSGKLVVKTKTLTVGAHSLSALYGGSTSYNGSISAAVVVTIT